MTSIVQDNIASRRDGNQEALGTRLCCSGRSRLNCHAQGTKKKLRGNQALPPYFKVWIRHCVASVEEDKVAEHFKHFVIRK